MLLVIAGFPATLVGMLFTGSLLIEAIFSPGWIGLAGIRGRGQPGLSGDVRHALHVQPDRAVAESVSDLSYHLVDPRIDFAAR